MIPADASWNTSWADRSHGLAGRNSSSDVPHSDSHLLRRHTEATSSIRSLDSRRTERRAALCRHRDVVGTDKKAGLWGRVEAHAGKEAERTAWTKKRRAGRAGRSENECSVESADETDCEKEEEEEDWRTEKK